MTPAAMAALHARVFTVPRPWGEREFAETLASPHSFATGDDRGFAVGRAIAGEAELLTICVAPEARRQGIGTALLRRIAAMARSRGADTLMLEVSSDNAAAIALYQAEGFGLTGRRRGYYRHTGGGATDALLMAKTLPPSAPA